MKVHIAAQANPDAEWADLGTIDINPIDNSMVRHLLNNDRVSVISLRFDDGSSLLYERV